jgi:hypothetical protein
MVDSMERTKVCRLAEKLAASSVVVLASKMVTLWAAWMV